MKYKVKSEECWKNALNLVAHFEGLRLTAYSCPAGHLTIGYGHRMAKGEPRQISRDAARDYLVSDFAKCVDSVFDLFPHLWESQLFALASLTFNLGLCWASPEKHLGREVAALNRRQSVSGSDVKLQYNVCWYLLCYRYYHDKNGRAVESDGLHRRRKAEKELFYGNLQFQSKK